MYHSLILNFNNYYLLFKITWSLLFVLSQQKKSEAEKFMSEKNKLLNIAYNVRNEISQEKINIDLLTSQLERICNKQNLLSKEESKLKKLILEKKEIVYNLVIGLHIKKNNVNRFNTAIILELSTRNYTNRNC